MKYIQVNDADRPIFVPVEEIVFLRSRESQTEIFLRSANEPVTVKEALTEIIKKLHAAKAAGHSDAVPLG